MLDEWDLAIRTLVALRSQADQQSKVWSSEISVIPRDIASKYKELVTKLGPTDDKKDNLGLGMFQVAGRPHEQRRPQSSSLVNTDEIHGRRLDRDILLRKIMDEGDHKLKCICILGLAGIGKTTLAQLLYNDSRVTDCYPFRCWISVSNSFDVVGMTELIIKKVAGYVPRIGPLDSPADLLRDFITGKRHFLVLDDVLDEHANLCYNLISTLREGNGAEDSTVLVTTRNELTARHLKFGEIYRVEQLSDKSCWSILSDEALSRRSFHQVAKFKEVGWEIAKKCNGIPHTAKVLGSLLRSKCSVEEWENVLETPLWELKEVSEDIFGPLLLTYHELSPDLRCCFSYCGIIPKGFEVYANKLIRCWHALGYLGWYGDLEGRGLTYLNKLADHSLFKEIVRVEFDFFTDSWTALLMCKMHDIVHDFSQFIGKKASGFINRGMTCQACGTSLVFDVQMYHSLSFQKDPPANICDCLKSLRVLSLRGCGLNRIPGNMMILIHLRFLDLSYNEGLCEEDLKTISQLCYLETLLLSSCGLEEIPTEIGSLFRLEYLDLSFNSCLTELPESICSLLKLQILNIDGCNSLTELPEAIGNLRNLGCLHNLSTRYSYPKRFEELVNLHMLNEFSGELSLLKGLHRLAGSLQIKIPESYCFDAVPEAKAARMYSKKYIKALEILFPSELSILGENGTDETTSMDILDALEPDSQLRYLKIELYGGSNLPAWIFSPFKDVREIELQQCNHLLTLPPLGQLPSLEVLTLQEMDGLQRVGKEFLGLTSEIGDKNVAPSSPSSTTVAFRALKALIFYKCPNWKAWEDITSKEEESHRISVLPRLKKLDVVACGELAVLPHRLLRKATGLEELDIYDSTQLVKVYEDKDGSDWDSISHIPQVRFD